MNDLFPQAADLNLLPYDGTVFYHGAIFDPATSAHYASCLHDTIPWEHDEVILFGKRHITSRKVAWIGDPGLSYTYSGSTKTPLPWTTVLLALKSTVEQRCATVFNACLLNYYRDGREGMGWHADNERSIVRRSCIASISLGAPRKFSFKHRQSGESRSIILENGSLLEMRDETQEHWLHCLPKSTRIQEPRINLTFRCMVTS